MKQIRKKFSCSDVYCIVKSAVREIKTSRLKGSCRTQNNYKRLKNKQELRDFSFLITSRAANKPLRDLVERKISHANHAKRKR